jgi:hypothetical protein
MSKTSLEQKIMTALTDDAATAADLADLISTTETAIVECEARAKREAENAVDPMLSTDPRQSQRASDDAAIEAGRLKTLLPRLESRHREILHATARAKWKERFDDLEHQRNNLAAELKATYPKVVSQLVELLSSIAINNNAISGLHGSRPSGSNGTLLGAELIARGLTEYSRDQPQLNLALPDWSEPSRLAWPPREMPASVLLSEAVATVHNRKRHSADWAEAMKEDAARRVAEEQERIQAEEQHTAADKAAYERSLPR